MLRLIFTVAHKVYCNYLYDWWSNNDVGKFNVPNILQSVTELIAFQFTPIIRFGLALAFETIEIIVFRQFEMRIVVYLFGRFKNFCVTFSARSNAVLAARFLSHWNSDNNLSIKKRSSIENDHWHIGKKAKFIRWTVRLRMKNVFFRIHF